MIFEETEMWEILVPCFNAGWDSTKANLIMRDWLKMIRSLVTGITIMSVNDGMWMDTEEQSFILRIACSEDSIKRIIEITADYYNQECIIAYKVSSKCFLGYR